jgi:hypothetical protein
MVAAWLLELWLWTLANTQRRDPPHPDRDRLCHPCFLRHSLRIGLRRILKPVDERNGSSSVSAGVGPSQKAILRYPFIVVHDRPRIATRTFPLDTPHYLALLCVRFPEISPRKAGPGGRFPPLKSVRSPGPLTLRAAMPKSIYPTSLRLPSDLKDFLAKRASAENRKLSQQIIHVLKQYRAFFQRSKGKVG